MQFRFDYFLAFEGLQVAHVEGIANIQPTPMDPDEWHIAGIHLEGLATTLTVAVPETAPLYKDMSLYLYRDKEQAINDAWDSHLAECRANKEAA